MHVYMHIMMYLYAHHDELISSTHISRCLSLLPNPTLGCCKIVYNDRRTVSDSVKRAEQASTRCHAATALCNSPRISLGLDQGLMIVSHHQDTA